MYINGGWNKNIIKQDIVTGYPIEFKDWSKILWKCTDVRLIEEKSEYGRDTYKHLHLILEYDSIKTCIEEFYVNEHSTLMRQVYLKSDWDRLVKKYGLTIVKTAFNHSIRVGMPTELLIYSRGEPKDINRASYGDQWVYSSLWSSPYVYVKGGKVTGWN